MGNKIPKGEGVEHISADIVLASSSWLPARAKVEILQWKKDAERLAVLRKLLGYVENGSNTMLKIFQDDATKEYIIKLGDDSRYFARSFEAVIDLAAEDLGDDN